MSERDQKAPAAPPVDAAQVAQRAMAEAAQQAAEERLDETVPGGRYEVDGRLVDANGEPVKGRDRDRE